MPADTSFKYEMTLVRTHEATGFFTCRPAPDINIDEAFARLCHHPMDTFLHDRALQLLVDMTSAERARWAEKNADEPVAEALAMEADLLTNTADTVSGADAERLADVTPALFLRSAALPDHTEHKAWAPIFKAHLETGSPMPPLADGPPALPAMPSPRSNPVHMSEIPPASSIPPPTGRIYTPAGAAAMAKLKLNKAGVLKEQLMRHVASLSPMALLHPWQLELHIDCDGLAYNLSGPQTAYGKGMDEDNAGVGCMMEVLERHCSYARITGRTVEGTVAGHQLEYGRMSNLNKRNLMTIDPNQLQLEVPYTDQAIYWISGVQKTASGELNVWVPAQSVFLFLNLSEPTLYSGLGSTGLAAHTDDDAARLAALLEIIERDADTVTLITPDTCFSITPDTPELAPLFNAYEKQGIQIQFQDITGPMGIPCYRCLVKDASGQMIKGTGAHLSGPKALMSALTETPFPFPGGPASAPAMPDIPAFKINELPDFTTGSAVTDLGRLEETLIKNGHDPVFIDLTRTDMEFPVYRALIPGMEVMNDFDRWARIPDRLWQSYMDRFSSS